MMGPSLHPQGSCPSLLANDPLSPPHLLQQVHARVDFGFVRERLRPFYSVTGRPSIDPEALVRLLVGYLYGR